MTRHIHASYILPLDWQGKFTGDTDEVYIEQRIEDIDDGKSNTIHFHLDNYDETMRLLNEYRNDNSEWSDSDGWKSE